MCSYCNSGITSLDIGFIFHRVGVKPAANPGALSDSIAQILAYTHAVLIFIVLPFFKPFKVVLTGSPFLICLLNRAQN